jgi:phosphoadenosine phosphosulfate reductase
MPLVEAEPLAAKSAELEGKPPQDIIAWALAEYAPRVGISTAFGVEGCALIDMAVKLDPRVQVFTVDTDFLFPETYELMERIQAKYGVAVQRVKGKVTKQEQEQQHGVALWERDPDLCCAIRKVEPTERVVEGLDAWFAGLRRDQSATRAGIQLLERYDHADGTPLVKVNPLAAWTRNDTWKYVLANDVPYSPLLDQGYKSIGCWPCTRAVAAGGDERSGRWAGQGKTECGIHTFMIRKA